MWSAQRHIQGGGRFEDDEVRLTSSIQLWLMWRSKGMDGYRRQINRLMVRLTVLILEV
jgi:hypothetical protein